MRYPPGLWLSMYMAGNACSMLFSPFLFLDIVYAQQWLPMNECCAPAMGVRHVEIANLGFLPARWRGDRLLPFWASMQMMQLYSIIGHTEVCSMMNG